MHEPTPSRKRFWLIAGAFFRRLFRRKKKQSSIYPLR